MSHNFTAIRGFTIIELSVVFMLFSIIVFISLNAFTAAQTRAGQEGDVQKILADIKTQQISAMTGDIQDDTKPGNYGIKFLTDRYILFKDTYDSNCDRIYGYTPPGMQLPPTPTPDASPCASEQVVVFLEGARFANVNLPNGEVIFLQPSGEVSGYNAAQNYVDLTSWKGERTLRFTFNALGVVTLQVI